MEEIVTLIIPEAPIPASDELAKRSRIEKRSMRLGTLDNAKGNADHLLNFLVEGVRAVLPIASVISVRKDNAAARAPDQVLDRLTAEADFVFSAMAD